MAAISYTNSPTPFSPETQSDLLCLLNREVAPHERLSWLTWLNSLMENTPAVDKSFTEQQLMLLIKICSKFAHWPTEIKLRRELAYLYENSSPKRGQELENERCLMELCLSMGWFCDAYDIYRKRALINPNDQKNIDCGWDIFDYDQQTPFCDPDLIDGELSLTPLQYRHQAGFAWQYAPPHIGELCNLPDFQSQQHWREWLSNSHNNHEQQVFAVIHQHWGFIGSVALSYSQGLGSFYYWFGDDFQGKGYGPRAVNLLLNLGQKYFHIYGCYAKVYCANFPSQKALKKLNFINLPYLLHGPQGPEKLYYSGPALPAWQVLRGAEIVFNASPRENLQITLLSDLMCS